MSVNGHQRLRVLFTFLLDHPLLSSAWSKMVAPVLLIMSAFQPVGRQIEEGNCAAQMIYANEVSEPFL